MLSAVEEIITESGFEAVKINAVATRAGVSKILIYRYFKSLEGLLTTYIKQHDFWINYIPEISGKEELPTFIKSMLRQQAELTRNNDILRRLYRWELNTNNKWIQQLREEREQKGKSIVNTVAKLTGQSPPGRNSSHCHSYNRLRYLSCLDSGKLPFLQWYSPSGRGRLDTTTKRSG